MDTIMSEVTTVRPPLSAVEIVNLQQRVLRGDEVSDEELRHALESLALARSNAGARASSKTKEPIVKLEGSVAERFAAFKKQKETAASDA
jgi:hypothetical protein